MAKSTVVGLIEDIVGPSALDATSVEMVEILGPEVIPVIIAGMTQDREGSENVISSLENLYSNLTAERIETGLPQDRPLNIRGLQPRAIEAVNRLIERANRKAGTTTTLRPSERGFTSGDIDTPSNIGIRRRPRGQQETKIDIEPDTSIDTRIDIDEEPDDGQRVSRRGRAAAAAAASAAGSIASTIASGSLVSGTQQPRLPRPAPTPAPTRPEPQPPTTPAPTPVPTPTRPDPLIRQRERIRPRLPKQIRRVSTIPTIEQEINETANISNLSTAQPISLVENTDISHNNIDYVRHMNALHLYSKNLFNTSF